MASGLRDAFLRALVLCGSACVLITEALSVFHGFTRLGVICGWIVVIPLVAYVVGVRDARWPGNLRALDVLSLIAIVGVVATVGLTALLSAPNSADAMAYHLPRVIYWVQARSVAFFPTPYLNQIMLQPFAEYAMAHTYLLSGGDRFVNLVQFTGFAGSIVGVSSIAQALGLSIRDQSIAALVCATLPNAILQASGAKNDALLTLWLVTAVYFAARRQVLFLALALGLALGTKATAYLFAPPMLLAVWLMTRKESHVKWSSAGMIAAGVLLLNGPQFIRNYQLSGSILGFDSAFGDGCLSAGAMRLSDGSRRLRTSSATFRSSWARVVMPGIPASITPSSKSTGRSESIRKIRRTPGDGRCTLLLRTPTMRRMPIIGGTCCCW